MSHYSMRYQSFDRTGRKAKSRPLAFALTLGTIIILLNSMSNVFRPTTTTIIADGGGIVKPTSKVSSNIKLHPTRGRSTIGRSTDAKGNTKRKPSRSSQATVMGMAIGYDLFIFQRFVGSLRRSGFQGTIILGVDPQKVDATIEAYLMAKNVTMKFIDHVECSTQFVNASDANLKASQKELLSCLAPYPYLKARWGRFPLLRDYLIECEHCTGPVLITDVRDTIFQRDPFGDDVPGGAVKGLQVFEEDPRMRTTNWLVEWPVRECKGISFDKPMLCSGTTVGTRQAMLDYLEAMHTEMKEWMKDPKCHFQINGDDQAIHNHLFYNTGKLGSYARAVPNRMGIVNTVGAQAAAVKKDHFAYTKKRGIPDSEAQVYPYPGTNLTVGRWVDEKFHLIDKDGYFSNLDGQRSCVVHQYDRFGYQLERWLQKTSGLLDSPWTAN